MQHITIEFWQLLETLSKLCAKLFLGQVFHKKMCFLWEHIVNMSASWWKMLMVNKRYSHSISASAIISTSRHALVRRPDVSQEVSHQWPQAK